MDLVHAQSIKTMIALLSASTKTYMYGCVNLTVYYLHWYPVNALLDPFALQ